VVNNPFLFVLRSKYSDFFLKKKRKWCQREYGILWPFQRSEKISHGIFSNEQTGRKQMDGRWAYTKTITVYAACWKTQTQAYTEERHWNTVIQIHVTRIMAILPCPRQTISFTSDSEWNAMLQFRSAGRGRRGPQAEPDRGLCLQGTVGPPTRYGTWPASCRNRFSARPTLSGLGSLSLNIAQRTKCLPYLGWSGLGCPV
jgi:hypothetical protein